MVVVGSNPRESIFLTLQIYHNRWIIDLVFSSFILGLIYPATNILPGDGKRKQWLGLPLLKHNANPY